jgi:tRNA nucleotidyltransferase (CCA-adding enzyme)
MRIVLTHEQADFDALASLLGAAFLDEGAYPVLPRRMNRNVSAFVTLYGAELPFVDNRDLPNEPIEMVCLVDTQSLTTIKGMHSGTRVHVIDHHARRSDLPAEWSVLTEEIGATATLFVEQLQEVNGNLSIVQATLLLLGIYEDTGSLTYTRTTDRDLLAAAYLLKKGASLRIAADFLNHPLSLAQQQLYDRLRAQAQTLDIQGYTVVVATGEAMEMEEELSTVVHKMRDLLDPDALIVLVSTRSGVQMIARSTTDNIDVAEIAASFGGGGHARAAASLIKNRAQEDILAELLRLLPQKIRPAITVAQIMSRTPQVLAPDTPVQEAAERMQRYGYEGYPVVQDGYVVGLLTRRAVDRAITHKLNFTASRLMNAGKVTIYPDDSVEHLQRLMTETGWGQVPVISRETSEIIGIVTRTDLLKTLNSQLSQVYALNLSERLQNALPPIRLALIKRIAEIAHNERLALYTVGGFVRDMLLERPSLDFDLVVEGDAITLGQALHQSLGGRLTAHSRFGTAKWILNSDRSSIADNLSHSNEIEGLPEFIDLISARTEFYVYPTALPTVERGSIKLDLHRRDFTINTLALRLDGHHYGELLDYWGGLNDLRMAQIRVLHSLSFVDDPTRMLRAVRFEQRFNFRIEQRTLELLGEALELLGRVSGDRIRHEIDHILDEENRIPMLARLNELGLLRAIHPALIWNDWIRDRMMALRVTQPPNDWSMDTGRMSFTRALAYLIWLIRLPVGAIREISGRLKFSQEFVDLLIAAGRLWNDLPGWTGQSPSKIVSRLEAAPPLAIYACFLLHQDHDTRLLLRHYMDQWRNISPGITGNDIRKLGLPPGPAYRRILTELRAARLDGIISSSEQEQALLVQYVEAERAKIN